MDRKFALGFLHMGIVVFSRRSESKDDISQIVNGFRLTRRLSIRGMFNYSNNRTVLLLTIFFNISDDCIFIQEGDDDSCYCCSNYMSSVWIVIVAPLPLLGTGRHSDSHHSDK